MLVVDFDWRLETSKVKNNTKQKLLAIDETYTKEVNEK